MDELLKLGDGYLNELIYLYGHYEFVELLKVSEYNGLLPFVNSILALDTFFGKKID
ncbi:hypothetical protein TDIS_2051 [Thermosulfurimonas dismutans]|uniref:Uncharacterized protein n=1 Tax=Thermosulfurimonas dismutans TaxID=999894 RepID=A0A179D248_9BACT|nr:hypothetical protein TDIS_2051 [Thermosulfurimonas dismutans]